MPPSWYIKKEAEFISSFVHSNLLRLITEADSEGLNYHEKMSQEVWDIKHHLKTCAENHLFAVLTLSLYTYEKLLTYVSDSKDDLMNNFMEVKSHLEKDIEAFEIHHD